MTDILDWSTTAASNTDVDGVSIAEGMNAAGVNNAMRAIMANVASLVAAIGGAAVSTGSSNAYAVTSGLSMATAYAQGALVAFEANHTNTGAATLDIDSVGAKDIKRVDGSALTAGDITSGGIYLVAYEAGADDFLLLNPTPVSNPLVADVEDQAISGGATITDKDLGTITTGTVTPDPGDRPSQKYVNGGAHTLAPSSNKGSYYLDITNNGSAGAITTSGWGLVTGDSFTTTDTHKFTCLCRISDLGSFLQVVAWQ